MLVRVKTLKLSNFKRKVTITLVFFTQHMNVQAQAEKSQTALSNFLVDSHRGKSGLKCLGTVLQGVGMNSTDR